MSAGSSPPNIYGRLDRSEAQNFRKCLSSCSVKSPDKYKLQQENICAGRVHPKPFRTIVLESFPISLSKKLKRIQNGRGSGINPSSVLSSCALISNSNFRVSPGVTSGPKQLKEGSNSSSTIYKRGEHNFAGGIKAPDK